MSEAMLLLGIVQLTVFQMSVHVLCVIPATYLFVHFVI